jgi:hypothetical protein
MEKKEERLMEHLLEFNEFIFEEKKKTYARVDIQNVERLELLPK